MALSLAILYTVLFMMTSGRENMSFQTSKNGIFYAAKLAKYAVPMTKYAVTTM